MDQYITEDQIRNDPDPKGRYNHGKIWTPQEYRELERLWTKTNLTFEEICNQLGRSHLGVFAKLDKHFHWMLFDFNRHAFRCLNRNEGNNMEPLSKIAIENAQINYPYITQIKEPTMQPTIQTKTLINGQDAANMTDEQIFQKIARLEQEIDKLKAIRAKSTKLEAAITAAEKDVADLVAYVDGR